MGEQKDNFNLVKSAAPSIADMHRFSHDAMATTFEIFIVHANAEYARQAGWACFTELDRLQQELSRFIENSDIRRISAFGAAEPVQVGLETFECLQIAAGVHGQTNGAFDVTVGGLMDCWLDEDKNLRSPPEDELALARRRCGMGLVQLDEDWHTVKLSIEGVKIDLGGIGKGYAVDRMGGVLDEWSIDRALIHGGSSSVLALNGPAGQKGWPITLSNPADRGEILSGINLKNQALSASGMEHGMHIIDPRKGEPVKAKLAAWAFAADAATADALTTAFMVMSEDEIAEYCAQHKETAAMIAAGPKKGAWREIEILRFGGWEMFTSAVTGA